MRGYTQDDVNVTEEEYRQAQDYIQQFPEVKEKNINFFSTSTDELVKSIKILDAAGGVCTLGATILFFRLVYNPVGLDKSDLTLKEYMRRMKDLVGFRQSEESERTSSARFFIKYFKKLVEKGWTPSESHRKLARGELAMELCNDDIDTVAEHMASDGWIEFKKWYTELKKQNESNVIEVKNSVLRVNGLKVISINQELPDKVREVVESCLPNLYKELKKKLKSL